MRTEFSIAVGVFPVELLAYHVSMVCAANWPKMGLFIYLIWYWVECMTSSVIHLHILHIFQT